MRLAETYIGKDGKALSSIISSSKIVEVVEISSGANLSKQLDEVRKSLSKSPSATYLVVAFRAHPCAMHKLPACKNWQMQKLGANLRYVFRIRAQHEKLT